MSKNASIVFAAIVVAIAGALYWVLHTGSGSSTPIVTAAPARPASAVPSSVILRSGALPHVILFADRNDLLLLESAIGKGDGARYGDIVQTRATVVDTGTHAQKLEEAHGGGVRVRVSDGPNAGFVGWAEKDDVH